jgi:ATP-dependent Clp protease ATP-binding subunit ClpX
MFTKTNFGVPQFYPRDLKKRVDAYVVGQDRAKKTICSTLFNHYQGVRRRRQHELEERNKRDKLSRQRLVRDRELHQRRRDGHPVEGQRFTDAPSRHSSADESPEDEFPGHNEALRHLNDRRELEEDPFESLYQAEDSSTPEPVKVDKSNMLLIGPTGVGKTYILE